MDFFLDILGFILIYIAVDYKRREESKIPTFSADGILIIVLVIVGANLIKM